MPMNMQLHSGIVSKEGNSTFSMTATTLDTDTWLITWTILMAIPSACTDHHVTSKNIKLYTQGSKNAVCKS